MHLDTVPTPKEKTPKSESETPYTTSGATIALRRATIASQPSRSLLQESPPGLIGQTGPTEVIDGAYTPKRATGKELHDRKNSEAPFRNLY